MKNSYIQFIISCMFICLTTQLYGKVAEYPFRERAQRSDLIVEGVIEKQMDNRSFDKKDLHSFRKKSIFKVSAVYKGNAAEGNSITVFSHMNFICDTSRKLAEGRRYLLMLKKHKSGFADVNYGRGMWEIVTNESGKQVVVSDSWLKTNGESYEQLKNNIAWALSEPPPWPKEPAISHEQAKKIALKELSKANVDLKGFVYKEHKPQPLKIGNNIIGIAYKGDPMWYFRWEKPEVENISPMPQGTFISCYIHAHTGKFYPKYQRKVFDQKPLTVEVTGPKNLLVGQYPNFQIEISNISNKPVELVRPLDGSWHHWRYPYISIEVYDQNGKGIPVKLSGRCGNMNPIVPEDIIRLNPEERMDFSIGWPFSRTVFEKPGKYSLVLSYDLRSPNIEAWVIAGRASNGKTNSKITKRIKRIPKLLIKSKPLNIKIHSVTKNMLESMVIEYYHEQTLFGFVAKDLKLGKWRICDIRQSNGWISCLVKFADGYTPPPPPKYVTKGHWLEEGRYLFEPCHDRSNRELHALPNNQTSIFKLHLPKDTAILTKKHEWLQGLAAKAKTTNPVVLIEDDETNYFEDTPIIIDNLVSEIVTRAESHDMEFFNKLLDGPYKGQEQKLIDMILRSDLSNNFKERLEHKNSDEARLNYHYLEKGCSFQIDLVKEESGWSVKKIWFCR